MIQVVIFDIDGTLVDTVDMHANAWQLAFKEFGKTLEFQKVREQIGTGGDQLMPDFFNSVSRLLPRLTSSASPRHWSTLC